MKNSLTVPYDIRLKCAAFGAPGEVIVDIRNFKFIPMDMARQRTQITQASSDEGAYTLPNTPTLDF